MSTEAIEFFKNYSVVVKTDIKIYPNPGEFPNTKSIGKALVCICHLLIGECGGFSQKMGKTLRSNEGSITKEMRKELILELGDILWYIAALCAEIEQDFSEQVVKAINYPLHEIEWNIIACCKKKIKKYDDSFYYLSYTMTSSAAEIAKKLHLVEPRDKSLDEGYYNILKSIHVVIACVFQSAKLLDSSLVEVIKMNVDKLFSRAIRDKLNRSGDKE